MFSFVSKHRDVIFFTPSSLSIAPGVLWPPSQFSQVIRSVIYVPAPSGENLYILDNERGDDPSKSVINKAKDDIHANTIIHRY